MTCRALKEEKKITHGSPGRARRSTLFCRKAAALLLTLALLLAAPGCIRYWEDVDKLQQENFELQDQLEWQAREEEMKAKKTAEESPSEAPLKASDY